MDEQVLKLLRKYLNNQCNAKELNRVRAILGSDTDKYEQEWNKALQEEAERSISADILPGTLPESEAERLLDRIIESADRDIKAGQPHRRRWYAAAASVLLLVTAGLAFLTLSSVWDTDSITETTTGEEQAEISLPDGTRVWLNNQSTLSYPEEFDGTARIVQLEGRAFFDVASNPSRSFLVQSGELLVRVLGTSFDVSAYESDWDMTVTVASGSVNVEGPSFAPNGPASGSAESGEPPAVQPENTLKPGEQLIYDRQNRQYFRQTVEASDLRALREGKLVFQNQALVNIVQALERRYEVSFRFENESDKRQRLTFKPNSADLEEVLQVLGLVSGLDYELDDGEVLMSRKQK